MAKGYILKWPSKRWALDRYEDGILPVLQEAADGIARECGAGYEARPAGQGRWGGGRVIVLTGNIRARIDEAKHHNLARYGGR